MRPLAAPQSRLLCAGVPSRAWTGGAYADPIGTGGALPTTASSDRAHAGRRSRLGRGVIYLHNMVRASQLLPDGDVPKVTIVASRALDQTLADVADGPAVRRFTFRRGMGIRRRVDSMARGVVRDRRIMSLERLVENWLRTCSYRARRGSVALPVSLGRVDPGLSTPAPAAPLPDRRCGGGVTRRSAVWWRRRLANTRSSRRCTWRLVGRAEVCPARLARGTAHTVRGIVGRPAYDG